MGTNDLARELHAPLGVANRSNLVPHLALAVLAAREAGKVILDGVYNDVRDAEGFAAECRQGVELGFDGKTLIHPGQVDACNGAWSPTAEEIENARRRGQRGPLELLLDERTVQSMPLKLATLYSHYLTDLFERRQFHEIAQFEELSVGARSRWSTLR